jgi:hypothetical protein
MLYSPQKYRNTTSKQDTGVVTLIGILGSETKYPPLLGEHKPPHPDYSLHSL